jgi:DNA-binding transcriptional regulator LsrR (DeoR family)
VWALRAQDLSQRGIAQRLGITRNVAQNDMRCCAEEWGNLPENGKAAVQGK